MIHNWNHWKIRMPNPSSSSNPGDTPQETKRRNKKEEVGPNKILHWSIRYRFSRWITCSRSRLHIALEFSRKLQNIITGLLRSWRPQTFLKVFEQLRMLSLQPRSKIFKRVHYFVIMTDQTRETWFPGLRLNRKQAKEEELYLAFFLSTISSNHIVDGPQMKLIRNAILEEE